MPLRIDKTTTDGLLRRYEILPPSDHNEGARPLAGGRKAILGGYVRDDGQKMITLTVGNVSESRVCPLDEREPNQVIERFCDLHLLPRHTSTKRMAEHLLFKASSMFANEPIQSFLFDGIQLHESDYRIGSVEIIATKHISAPKPEPKRQDRGAHGHGARPSPK